MFNFIPDFDEKLEKVKHIKYCKGIIYNVLSSQVIPKYETLKIYFLYSSLSALKILNEIGNLKTKEKIKKFINKCLKFNYKKGEFFALQSPFLNLHKSKFDLITFYFIVVIKKYLNLNFEEKETKIIKKNLNSIEIKKLDLRELYCYCCLTKYFKIEILQKEKIIKFIQNLKTFDNAYGFEKNNESHAGATYCCVKILYIIKKENYLIDKKKLIYWCVNKQQEFGFSGRTNKMEDSCYTFWIGGILSELKKLEIVNKEKLRMFLLMCQDIKNGGLKKYPYSDKSDPIHCFHGLLGGAIFNVFELNIKDNFELII